MLMNVETIVSQAVVETPPAVAEVSTPAVATPAISNRALKSATHQLLTTGTLPKGFAKILKEVGTEEQKAKISEARKARNETLAQTWARQEALAQTKAQILSAKRFSWRDRAEQGGSFSWSNPSKK